MKNAYFGTLLFTTTKLLHYLNEILKQSSDSIDTHSHIYFSIVNFKNIIFTNTELMKIAVFSITCILSLYLTKSDVLPTKQKVECLLQFFFYCGLCSYVGNVCDGFFCCNEYSPQTENAKSEIGCDDTDRMTN